MHIAINTRFLMKGKLEGIGWFTHEIVRRMVLAHPQDQFTLIFDREYDPSFIYADNVKAVIVPPPARHPILMWWYYNIGITRLLKKIKADVFLSTDSMTTLYTSTPQVLVVHDLAYVHYPNYNKKSASLFLNYYTPKFIEKADHIVAVSNYTKYDITITYGTLPEKISVIYNSANDAFMPRTYEERKTIKEKTVEGVDYFLYVGSLHPRKNIVRMLNAFQLFKRNTGSDMKLILVGRLAWLTSEIELALEQHIYKKDILRYDYLNADQVAELTSAAYGCIYPSLFEGFGIPVLEAIRCHVPVITSNTSSLPEVGGAACIYVNPENEIEIADAMMKIYTDENYRNLLVSACATQSTLFDWNKSASQMYDVLCAVAAKRQAKR